MNWGVGRGGMECAWPVWGIGVLLKGCTQGQAFGVDSGAAVGSEQGTNYGLFILTSLTCISTFNLLARTQWLELLHPAMMKLGEP